MVVQSRCMLCGKTFEAEPTVEASLWSDGERQRKRTLSVCPLCQAKVKKEADDAQKLPKPM
jgi:DNA-directed RNA polymerase subunit RPC12/RpoP